jgi:hypothetical protein
MNKQFFKKKKKHETMGKKFIKAQNQIKRDKKNLSQPEIEG